MTFPIIHDIIPTESEVIEMTYPHIACPECESQILNPTHEDGILHFVCECGAEVWYDDCEEECKYK